MKYGGKYWNIKDYLPYQRNFNFIDSERTIGKTYTTQGFMVERALERHQESIYIVRTQDEIKKGVLWDAFQKVLFEQFDSYEFKCKGRDLVCEIDESVYIPICHAIALSEANKSKRTNLPNIKWGLFDEYIVDTKGTREYVNGWDEPNLLLKLYHTIDREQDKLTLFFLSNSIQFYNPYHIHKAFRIPKQVKGKIWTSENVLYHWTEATEELKAEKATSKFLRMIEGTEYGTYALEGDFIFDNDTNVAERNKRANFQYTIITPEGYFGVWWDYYSQTAYIDVTYDKNSNRKYSFDIDCKDKEAILVKGKELPSMKFLGNCVKKRNVRFNSIETKNKVMEYLIKVI